VDQNAAGSGASVAGAAAAATTGAAAVAVKIAALPRTAALDVTLGHRVMPQAIAAPQPPSDANNASLASLGPHVHLP
jgi:hypothetical protein